MVAQLSSGSFGKKDALAYFRLIMSNKDRLRRYFPKTMEAVQTAPDAFAVLHAKLDQWRNKALYPFGIFMDDQLIGWISVKNIDWQVPKCELGYYLDEAATGQGIASQALDWLTRYCFIQLGMNKLFLRIGQDNPGSIRVAEKNGFTLEGTLKNEYITGDGETSRCALLR